MKSLLICGVIAGAASCNKRVEPSPPLAAAVIPRQVPAWEPMDPTFHGCEGS